MNPKRYFSCSRQSVVTRPYTFLLGMIIFILFGSLRAFAGSWYVSNTAPGEWIQFDNAWLPAGNYRFTANAGAIAGGAFMHLEIDGLVVRYCVPVPVTGRVDSFAYVNIGNVALGEGYHTIRVVFETAGISLDWFTLRNDSDTSTQVKPSDTTMIRPSTATTLISPVVAFSDASNHNAIFGANDAAYLIDDMPKADVKGNAYSAAQLTGWYRVPMFEDLDRRTDRYWDTMIAELVSTRSQVPLIHCRVTSDFTHDLQDRGYQPGGGGYEGRWLKKFVEAVQRNPQAASSLQIGMFLEDSGLASGYNAMYGHYPTGWGDPTLASYAVQYWLEPWFDQVPASLLYQPSPMAPIINVWTGHPNGLTQDGKMSTFLTSIQGMLNAKYGYNPTFLVSTGADAGAKAMAAGVTTWGAWGPPMYVSLTTNGKTFGFSEAGSRRRLDTVWLNDWNPATNTGTPCTGCDSPGVDNFLSPLDANGNSVLLSAYSQAVAANTTLIFEEGFYNISEGNMILPSRAPGWSFPNQHIAAMRQYADPTAQSQIFQAEDADEYYKVDTHQNLGGTYRNEWYRNTGLDVYQPLHNFSSSWTHQPTGPGNLVSISAGFFDVWALDANGQIWDHGISDGTFNSTWTTVAMNGVSKFTQLAVGKHHVWALNGNAIYYARLPYGQAWESNTHTSWALVSGSLSQLSVDEAEVWGVNSSGLIYKRRMNGPDYPGDAWQFVQGPGPLVSKVYVGGNSKFVWSMAGNQIFFTPKSSIAWTEVQNTYNLTDLSVGSQEVWGVNASGNIYRRSISGVGDWESVDGTLTAISVGENYAWGLQTSTPFSNHLWGFSGSPMAAIPDVPTGLAAVQGNGQASVAWSPLLGAAGYNLKRSVVSGGPYSTISVSADTAFVDSGLTNGSTYYYVVTAFNGVGESAPSGEVSVTP